MQTKFIIIVLLVVGLLGCKKDSPTNDPEAPGRLTNVRFTPLHGGGYFLYDIPHDPDFLYVAAKYKTDQGEVITKTNSVYSDTLYIEGLGQAAVYDIALYTIDRAGHERLSSIAQVTPLSPAVDEIAQSIRVRGAFSSLVVDVENPLGVRADVFVTCQNGDQTMTNIFASTKAKDRFFVNDMEEKDYKIRAYVQDLYGNRSSEIELGTVSPIADYPLDKSLWQLIEDSRLPDTLAGPDTKNAEEKYLDGDIRKFWNNEVDDPTLINYFDFYVAKSGGPISYYIDLGREVQASRVRVWQRSSGGYGYGTFNVQEFELYVSNDVTPDGYIINWKKLNSFKIEVPNNEVDKDKELKAGHLFLIYPDDPVLTTPFRYLRYRAVKPFVPSTALCASEITLYGIETNN